MEESTWNAINSYFGNDLERPLSRARVEVLYGLVTYKPKVVMMKYRIKINPEYFMMSDEEIDEAQAAANAADTADVFHQLENSPGVRDVEQVQSRKISTAERAARVAAGVAVNVATSAARVLSASALCGGGGNKRERDRNVSTADQKKESGKSNPDTKSSKMAPLKSEEIDMANENIDSAPTAAAPTAAAPTVADIDSAVLPHQGAAGDGLVNIKRRIKHQEKYFDYSDDDSVDPEDDDEDEEVSTSEPDIKMSAGMKPAAKPDHSPFPPKSLSIKGDFDVDNLISEMKSRCQLDAPDVKEEHLFSPDGLDHHELNAMRGRRGGTASALAQGFMIHDTTELRGMGFAEDVAKFIKTAENQIQDLEQDDMFRVPVDYEEKTCEGIFCNSCDAEIRTSAPTAIRRNLLQHAARCGDTCPSCELHDSTLYAWYKLDKYYEYISLLCPDEEEVDFEDFVDKALAYSTELSIYEARKFFCSKAWLYRCHAMLPSGPTPKGGHVHTNNCAVWYDGYQKFRAYVHEHKSTKIKKKEVTALFSISSDKDADLLCNKLRDFRKKFVDDNGDGSYGEKSIDNNFAGARWNQIRALHYYIEKENTKGMKKLTTMGFSKRKK